MPQKNKVKKMNWFILASLSMVCFTIIYLLTKKLTTSNLSSTVIYAYPSLIIAIMLVIYLSLTNNFTPITGGQIWIIVIISVLAIAGNIFLTQSIRSSPNPGYSLAISGLDIVLVTLISITLFKSEFNSLKILGVILAIVSIVLLSI